MTNKTRCAASCPFSHKSCTECAVYRGRHHYLMFPDEHRSNNGTKDMIAAYFQVLEELSDPWAGKGSQTKSNPSVQLTVVDMESRKTTLCELDEAKTWDWSNPETMRLIDGRQVRSFDTLIDILCYRAEKGQREVEIRVFPRFMLLAGG